MYKVQRFRNSNASILQQKIAHWIETEKHICIISINVWSHKEYNYALIVYREEQFNL